MVRTVRDTPPAALLACPVAPVFTSAPGGSLPKEKRLELASLATAYRENTDQLLRLIGWHSPGSCGTPARPPAEP